MQTSLFALIAVSFLSVQIRGENTDQLGSVLQEQPCSDPEACWIWKTKEEGLRKLSEEYVASQLKLTSLTLDVNQIIYEQRNNTQLFLSVLPENARKEERRIFQQGTVYYQAALLEGKKASYFRCVSASAATGKRRITNEQNYITDAVRRKCRETVEEMKSLEGELKKIESTLKDVKTTYEKKIKSCLLDSCVKTKLQEALTEFKRVMKPSEDMFLAVEGCADLFQTIVSIIRNMYEINLSRIASEEINNMDKCE